MSEPQVSVEKLLIVHDHLSADLILVRAQIDHSLFIGRFKQDEK